MPVDGTPSHTDAVSSVARRFWILLTVILALAIGSSILALRLVAVPYFTEQQRQVVAEMAQNAAQHLEEWLARKQMLLGFVANDPNVQNIALGYSDNTDYFHDLLASLPTTENLSWITFYDALGDNLVSFGPRPEERDLFTPDILEGLVRQALEEEAQQRTPAAVHQDGGLAHIITVTQVRPSNYVEGVLLAAYRVPLTDVLVASETIREAFVMASTDARPSSGQTERVALDRVALTLAITPDISAVEAAGRQLITNGVTAIAAVLLGAFSIFALLGRRVIIAPHQRLEDQAQRLEAQSRDLAELAAIAERANDALVVTDLDGRVTWANPSFERITGYALDVVRGRKPGEILQGPDTDPTTVQRIRHALAERRAVQVEIQNYDANRNPYWINLSISPLTSDTGEAYGFMAISSDITEARKNHEALLAAKQEIEHQALHDPLTGLPNRRALEQAMAERRRQSQNDFTLVRIDLDHFKHVNDTMGHEAGDFVLVEVANILRAETRAADLPVRIGGDEFVLLLEPGATETVGVRLAERILDQIRAPKFYENKTIRVGASFGVAGMTNRLLEERDLIIGADAALYAAKEAGRNRIHVYTPELHKAALSHRDLARELRLAVARDELEPFFQAQYDAQTQEIIGVETLARWRSPVFGLLAPHRFLPVAHQLSLVEEIDDQIFQKAVTEISALRAEGVNIPKMSVNVTANRIQDRRVFERLRDLPSNAPKIAFEILESVLVEEQSDMFRWGLDTLRDLGVSIEIDDFGSGHASIIGLMQLRPDAMKIDRRLVMPILDDALARGVLDRIVSMASLMDLTVVAEGVETADHARVLAEIGCHVLQGYHFCQPMPAKDLHNVILSKSAGAGDLHHAVGL